VIEIGKFRIRPLRFPQSASLFSVHTQNKKKLIVRKSSLGLPLLESKRNFFKLIIDRDINDLFRYPFGTISKSFYSVLPFGSFMSFAPPPVFLSFRSLRSLSFICIKQEGGGKDINKPNGNTFQFWSICLER
jgi:hypothetical protein